MLKPSLLLLLLLLAAGEPEAQPRSTECPARALPEWALGEGECRAEIVEASVLANGGIRARIIKTFPGTYMIHGLVSRQHPGGPAILSITPSKDGRRVSGACSNLEVGSKVRDTDAWEVVSGEVEILLHSEETGEWRCPELTTPLKATSSMQWKLVVVGPLRNACAGSAKTDGDTECEENEFNLPPTVSQTSN